MIKDIAKDEIRHEYIKRQIKKPTAKIWWILKWLLSGEEISPITAFEKFQTMSLAAIISRFRNELNIPIESNMQKAINSDGRIVHYAKYRITPSHLREERERFGIVN